MLESTVRQGVWYIGADHTMQFNVKNKTTGLPQTMTGWTLEYRLVTQAGAIQFTKTGASITLSNEEGTNDAATVAIADTDTDALTEGWYRDSIWRTDSGAEQPIGGGAVYLSKVV